MARTTPMTVHTKSIYHGLPTFPPSIKGLTAIVTGANGISGNYMLRVLAQSPERWEKIWCLSRRPPAIADKMPTNAEHVPLDFLKSPEEIATAMKEKGISKADYIFFFSYIQPDPGEGKGLWSNADELVNVNSALLNNFLGGLTHASITPRRFMLQTGAKNYGLHLGPVKAPQEESDPRVTLEPNFYYPQEDSLMRWCASNGCEWNVAMPSYILGAVPDAAMNAAYPLAIYAAVCKHTNRPIEFPGDMTAWQALTSGSSSMMNAYLEEWAVLTPAAKNQRFNACDDYPVTWEKLLPKVAGWYGVDYKGPDMSAKFTEITMPHDPPPRGYGPPGKVRYKFSFVEWIKQPENIKAWTELKEQHGLVGKDLGDMSSIFSFLDGWATVATEPYFSMSKARKLGWHGFTDSAESLHQVFTELAQLKMVPPIPDVHVEFS